MDHREVRWQRLVNAARQAPTTTLELSGDRLAAILSAAATPRTQMASVPRWCEVTAWCMLAASVMFALSLADLSPLATSGLVDLAEVCPWGPVP